MRDTREARPYVATETKIKRIKTMADSDSGESGGEGSCGDSACACPSSYVPVESRMRNAPKMPGIK